MTVHLVNLTNPMMMKGPFRSLIPVSATVEFRVPPSTRVTGVKLLLQGKEPEIKNNNDVISISVPVITDHEIIAFDIA